MTATYNTSLAADRDKVRFLIGDRDTTAALFSDEEIAAVLALYPDTTNAACELLESALSQYSLTPSTSNAGLEVGAERYTQIKDRLDRLRRISASRIAAPVLCVGGISIAARDDQIADSDLIQPTFRTNQYNTPAEPVRADEETKQCF